VRGLPSEAEVDRAAAAVVHGVEQLVAVAVVVVGLDDEVDEFGFRAVAQGPLRDGPREAPDVGAHVRHEAERR
jgi:hypothetical protein